VWSVIEMEACEALVHASGLCISHVTGKLKFGQGKRLANNVWYMIEALPYTGRIFIHKVTVFCDWVVWDLRFCTSLLHCENVNFTIFMGANFS